MIAVSTTSITTIEAVSAASAVRPAADGHPGRDQRAHRQRVPEQEGERDRQYDGREVVPAEPGRDHEPSTSPMPQPVRQ